MKIEDLIQLLNNRLREFKLSRDYARMSGDLERMNAADKEVLALEDTLYKLNLLVDTSKSAAVKEEILSEVITDGSVSVLGEYDITLYATDPLHEEKIMTILSNMGVMDTVEKIEAYIRGKYVSSPVTGEMVMSAALAYSVDTRLMMAIMEQDSRFGTAGLAVSTLNPGNVGNDDDGNTRTYDSWQEGVTAVAEWLSRHRGSTSISETPLEITASSGTPPEAVAATSTPSIIIPITTATTTPIITTSTTTTITNLPTTATSTPIMATSTPITATTPVIATTTPTTATSTTTTPVIAPSTSSPQQSSGQAGQATSTPTTTTSTTATTTPVIATTTPSTATSTPTTAPSTSSPQQSSGQAGQATTTPTTSTLTTATSTDSTSSPQAAN